MREVKLICFDLDDTLIENGGWRKLNTSLGMAPEQDNEYLRIYKEGKLTYEDWVKLSLKVYKESGKANFDYIKKVVSGYKYKLGAKEIISYLKEKGYNICLISGALDILVDEVGNDLGIDLRKSNTSFLFDGDKNLENISCIGDESESKLKILKSFCDKMMIALEDCVCVGDGDNDLDIFLATGRGITFRGSEIEDQAWKVVDRLEDLKLLF